MFLSVWYRFVHRELHRKHLKNQNFIFETSNVRVPQVKDFTATGLSDTDYRLYLSPFDSEGGNGGGGGSQQESRVQCHVTMLTSEALFCKVRGDSLQRLGNTNIKVTVSSKARRSSLFFLYVYVRARLASGCGGRHLRLVRVTCGC